MYNIEKLYLNISLVVCAFIFIFILSSCADSSNDKHYITAKENIDIFVAHNALYVTALAFSPDGKILATGSPDETVKIWDVQSLYDSKMIFEPNKKAKKIIRVKGTINSLVFSPNGGLLAITGNDEKGVLLWNTKSWTKEKEIQTPTSKLPQGSVIFSPDGQYLAISNDDAYIYDLSLPDSPPKLVKVVPDAYGPIAFSSNGKWFADGNSRNLSVWSTTSWKCIRSFTGKWGNKYHGKAESGAFIESIAFSHNNKWLAASSDDDKIRVFDTTTWKIIKTINNDGYVANLAFSPNNKTLAATGKTVRLLDTTTWKNRKSVQTIKWNSLPWTPPKSLKDRENFYWSWVSCITFSPTGRILAMSGEGPLVVLWHY